MTLTQIKCFLALERFGSFVEAAKSLHVTQPALTVQIKNLEDELDTVLFDRNLKPIVPTEAGQIFSEQARVVMLEVEKAQNILEDFKQQEAGELRIGIIPTVAPYLLPLFLNEFHSKYPALRLSIKEMVTEEIVTAIKNNELDAGLAATPLKAKSLLSKPLFYEQYFLYVSELHPFYNRESIALNELHEADLWLLNQGNCFRNQVLHICTLARKSTLSKGFNFESSSIESLKRIVEFTQGTTIIPELATLNVPSEKEEMIKEIEQLNAVREVSLITNKTVVKAHLLEKLEKIIKQAMPSKMLKKPKGKVLETGISLL